jgi:hypothetical protein
MQELDTMSIRLQYAGGRAEGRMQKDKLKTLKKALLYSYQAATAILADGREFRCLINPDKLKMDYDNKILSIPYKDICLNSEFLGLPTHLAEEPTNIKVGDVFTWKETNTHWIVYMQFLEEDSYFRGEIRECDGILTIGDRDYYTYVRGPIETTIRWNLKSNISWNNLNYSAVCYLPADETTETLKRFSIVKLNGQNYEVQVVNRFTSGGILVVYLSEYYSNSLEEEQKQKEEKEEIIISEIIGETVVKPYDIALYSVGEGGGTWSVSNSKAKIIATGDGTATVEITTGRSGSVDLLYTRANGEVLTLPIRIESF